MSCERAVCVGLGLLLGIAVSAASAAPTTINDASNSREPKEAPWLGNAIGKDTVVLPGYDPIVVDRTTLRIGEREYRWQKGFVPAVISSRDAPFVKNMRLRAEIDGQVRELLADTVEVSEATEDHAVVVASGAIAPGLTLRTSTRVEYDGTAMIDVSLSPAYGVDIQSLDYVADIAFTPSMQTIGFGADTIREQKNRHDMLTLPYSSDFMNVLGFADGERSFWWFADDARGWLWRDGPVTQVAKRKDSLRLTQHLIGGTWRIDAPIRLSFNILATPVAKIDAAWRRQRVVAGVPDAEQMRHGAKFKVWWPEALAHDAYPYTSLAPDVQRLVPAADLSGYPGVAVNRALVQGDRRRYDAEWLPYFSAHVLSNLDPAMAAYKSQWEIQPRKEFRESVLPYTFVAGKPVLSHRGESYTDYILYRIAEVIDEIDIAGIYLDHGPVHDTVNPAHGGWRDASGRIHPSLDILATRAFLKRLRTLFWTKGKPGYVLIHDSNREIIPAYTFAYAQFTGEQYRSGRVRDGKFLSVVSLDELRTRMAADQYGIRTLWLPVEWTYHDGDKSWNGSERQRKADRSYESLVLLHDVMAHSRGQHAASRNALYEAMDEFGIDRAQFVGYWNAARGVTSSPEAVKVSVYRRDDNRSMFYVAANIGEAGVMAHVAADAAEFGCQPGDIAYHGEAALAERDDDGGEVKMALRIPANDFVWFVLRARCGAVTPGAHL